jgi:hypothetical protein
LIYGGIGKSKIKPSIGEHFYGHTNIRAHRTGQRKPVSVKRIIVKDTVEERILALQEQKIAIADTALGDKATVRVGRLNIRELVSLFGTVKKDRYGDLQIQQ